MSVTVTRVSRGRRVRPAWARGSNILRAICIAVIAITILMAIFGPLIAPYNPNALNLADAFRGSTGGHLLGFDSQGRDLLSRLIVGARTAMLGPIVVMALSVLIGGVVAIAAAWRGGWVDSVTESVTGVLFAFPGILLAVLATAVFGPGLTAAGIALTIAYIPYVARVLRAAAISERNLPYVAALEIQGESAIRICFRHIVPNILRLIVAEATILIGWAMLDLAAISFLGLGIQPPQADWGVMVSEGKTGVLEGFPAESLAAGLAIIFVVVAFTILGEQLAENTLERNVWA